MAFTVLSALGAADFLALRASTGVGVGVGDGLVLLSVIMTFDLILLLSVFALFIGFSAFAGDGLGDGLGVEVCMSPQF